VKRLLSIPQIALIAAFMLIAFGLTCYEVKHGMQNSPNSGIAGPAMPIAKKMLTITRDERIREIADTHEEVSNIDLAQEKVAFKIRVPKNTLSGELEGIFVEKVEDPKERGVRLVYSNGIFIHEMPCDPAPDYEKFVAQHISNVELGLEPQVVFCNILVNGFGGMGVEPGVNELGGEKFSRPGSVDWYDCGTKYLILGGDIGLRDLKMVAESMY